MPYISKYGNKEQIERFIPEMTAGRCIGAIAMTEPGAGRSELERCWSIVGIGTSSSHVMSCRLFPFSDLQGVRTYARRDGSDWILNGNKVLGLFGSWCPEADDSVFLVM